MTFKPHVAFASYILIYISLRLIFRTFFVLPHDRDYSYKSTTFNFKRRLKIFHFHIIFHHTYLRASWDYLKKTTNCPNLHGNEEGKVFSLFFFLHRLFFRKIIKNVNFLSLSLSHTLFFFLSFSSNTFEGL